jgi:hypothetical protein
MVIELEKKYNPREMDKLLRKMKSKKIFDSRCFAGKILCDEDPLIYQKRVRNEWD